MCVYIYTYIYIIIYIWYHRCIQLLTKLATEDFEEEQHDRIFKIFKHISINISTCGLRPTIMYTTSQGHVVPRPPLRPGPSTASTQAGDNGRQQGQCDALSGFHRKMVAQHQKRSIQTRETCFNKGKMMRDWDIMG